MLAIGIQVWSKLSGLSRLVLRDWSPIWQLVPLASWRKQKTVKDAQRHYFIYYVCIINREAQTKYYESSENGYKVLDSVLRILRNTLCNPCQISYFLFLQFHVTIEDTELELLQEREPIQVHFRGKEVVL